MPSYAAIEAPSSSTAAMDSTDDDNISLTSSVPDDVNAEHDVEDILAERDFNGRTYYLTAWTGKPVEVASWEPIESFSNPHGAIEMWKKSKEAIKLGEKEQVDLYELQRMAQEKRMAREERKRRRMAKRARLSGVIKQEGQTREQGPPQALPASDAVNGGENAASTDERAVPAQTATTAASSIPLAATPQSPQPTRAIPSALPLDMAAPQTPAPQQQQQQQQQEPQQEPAAESDRDYEPELSPMTAAVRSVEDGTFRNPYQASRHYQVDYNGVRTRLARRQQQQHPQRSSTDRESVGGNNGNSNSNGNNNGNGNGNGTESASKIAYRRLRKLTDEEEEQLAQSILSRREDPPPKGQLHVMAMNIAHKRDPSITLSYGWPDSFMVRHPEVWELYNGPGANGGNGVGSGKRKYYTYVMEPAPDSPATPAPAAKSTATGGGVHGGLRASRGQPPKENSVQTSMQPPPPPQLPSFSTTTAPTPAPVLAPSATPPSPRCKLVRFKIRFGEEVRFVLVNADVSFAEFEAKVKSKLGIATGAGANGVRLQVRDEEDMVTIGDQEDLSIVIAQAATPEAGGSEVMGRAEIWVKLL